MGIDSIGKPKSPVAGMPAASSGVSDIASDQTFEVRSAKTTEVSGTSAIDQLHAGKIDVPQYLDQKVEQATAHLEGKVPAEKLQWIKETLRTQMEQDPMLSELVRRATQGVTETTGSNG